MPAPEIVEIGGKKYEIGMRTFIGIADGPSALTSVQLHEVVAVPLKVGDRVKWSSAGSIYDSYPGEILAIADDLAWLRWRISCVPRDVVHISGKLEQLELWP